MAEQNETTSPASPKPGKDRWVKRGFVIALLVAAAVVAFFQLRGPKLGWPSDLDAALAQAQAGNRKVVVFVRSFPLSTEAKDLISGPLSRPENRQALEKGNFILVEIGLDRDADWAKRYGVAKSPTMLVISPDAQSFHKAEGFIGEVEFRAQFLTAPLNEKVKR